MKLLFDQNLSVRLVHRLADLYPDARHVSSVSLDCATDVEVWEFAKANELTIVTKDADFNDFSVIRGFPPKVVWIRAGNCTTRTVEAILRAQYEALLAFHADREAAVLVLG